MKKTELKGKFVGILLATLIVVSVFSVPSVCYASDDEIEKVLAQIFLCSSWDPEYMQLYGYSTYPTEDFILYIIYQEEVKEYPEPPADVILVLYDKSIKDFSGDRLTAFTLYREWYLNTQRTSILNELKSFTETDLFTKDINELSDWSSTTGDIDLIEGILKSAGVKLLNEALHKPVYIIYKICQGFGAGFALLVFKSDFDSTFVTELCRIHMLETSTEKFDDTLDPSAEDIITSIENEKIGQYIYHRTPWDEDNFGPITWDEVHSYYDSSDVNGHMKGWFNSLPFVETFYAKSVGNIWVDDVNNYLTYAKEDIDNFDTTPSATNYRNAILNIITAMDHMRITYIYKSATHSQYSGCNDFYTDCNLNRKILPYPYSDGLKGITGYIYAGPEECWEVSWDSVINGKDFCDNVDEIYEAIDASQKADLWKKKSLEIIDKYLLLSDKLDESIDYLIVPSCGVTGSISATSDPPGANVQLDEKTWLFGETPVLIGNVPTGGHIVKMYHPWHGYSCQKVIYVNQNPQTDVFCDFINPEGTVRLLGIIKSVNSLDNSYDIKVVLVEAGHFPFSTAHVIVGQTSADIDPDLKVGDKVEVFGFYCGKICKNCLSLETETPDEYYLRHISFGTGSIDVTSVPSGAKIYLDSEFVDETPFLIEDIFVGGHQIKLSTGYDTYHETITVEANKQTDVSHTFAQQYYNVFVHVYNATSGQMISGAKVFLDIFSFDPNNYHLKETDPGGEAIFPLVPMGEHDFSGNKAGYEISGAKTYFVASDMGIGIGLIPEGYQDAIAPSVSIASPADNANVEEGTIEVRGTASDNLGVSKVEIRVNDGNYYMVEDTGTQTLPYLTWKATADLTQSINDIWVRATDHASNEKTISITVLKVGSSNPPVVNITSPQNDAQTPDWHITVKGTASDDAGIKKVEVKVNNGAWWLAEPVDGTDWAQWKAFVELPKDYNTIRAKATDIHGTTNTTYVIVHYNPDIDITVRKSGGADYTSIKSAVNAAHDGDIIYVYDGTYSKPFTIKTNNLTLLAQSENAMIDGSGSYKAAVYLESNNVMINGFTIKNADVGILVEENTHGNQITNNHFVNQDTGLELEEGSHDNKVSANTVNSKENGIYLDESDNNTITGNTISTNYANGHGIYLSNSDGNNIRNNQVSSNRIGIKLEDADNNKVSGTSFNTNYVSISLKDSLQNIIGPDNTVPDGHYGISLHGGGHNKIIRNTITNIPDDAGIKLDDHSTYNEIKDNTIKNSRTGIYTEGQSDYTSIIGNSLESNDYGMFIETRNSNIIGNHVKSTVNTGIGVYNIGSTIKENTIEGTSQYYGLYVCGSPNFVYHNNLINNHIHAKNGGASWDNGPIDGGNYWSGHTCTGNPSDGSESYSLIGGVDTYPFQDPNGWWKPSLTLIFEDPTPMDGTFIGKNYVEVNVSISKPVLSAFLKWNGNDYHMLKTGDNYYYNITGLDEGIHSFLVYTGDSATRTSEMRSIVIDGTPPVLGIKYPLNNSVFESNEIIINGTSSDNQGLKRVEVSVNGDYWRIAYGLSSWYLPLDISEGINEIEVRAKDIAGTYTEEKIHVTVTKGGVLMILDYQPDSDPTSIQNISQTFSIVTTQICNITWRINSSIVQTNISTTTASYINDSAVLGIYNVTVIAENVNGTDSQSWIWSVVSAISSPVASFTYSPENPEVNQPVTFDASSSHDPDGTVVNHEWDFDDGTNVTGEVVTHSYTSEGTYDVTLTVTDNDGATNSTINVITVGEGQGYCREITIKENTGNALINYQVLVELNTSNFPVEAKADGSDLRFAENGKELHYWIEDYNVSVKTAKIWVKLPSIPANGNVKFKMCYGKPAAISASDGDKTFEFFDDFSQENLDKWDDSTPSHIFEDGIVRFGKYESYCTTEYADKKFNTTQLTITVRQKAIPGELDWWGDCTFCGPMYCRAPGTATNYLDANETWLGQFFVGYYGGRTEESLNSCEDTHRFRISYDDWYREEIKAPEEKPPGVSGENKLNIRLFAYRCLGGASYEYVDWIFVRKYASIEPTVSISHEENQLPIASFTYSPDNPEVNQPVTFDASSSHDPDGTVVNHGWNFGDGANATGKIVTHSYVANGTYEVTLTVTDNNGTTNTTSKLISVGITRLLFEDTFDNGLNNWDLYGLPRPVIRSDYGNPSPCFDNKGDANYDSGAFSKQRFDYSSGLFIECDMLVNDARYNGCWVGSRFGIASAVHSSDYDSTPTAIGIDYTAVGPACWASAPEDRGHGRRRYFIINETGKTEMFEELGGSADLDFDKWHSYRIYIRPDRIVEFYKSEELIYTTKSKVSLDYVNMPLVLGARSHSSYGPALHDNVKVYAWGNQLPIASFTYSPFNPVANQTITFATSLSYDPDGTIEKYEWDFGDGNLTNTAEPIITHSYASEGTYNVTLTVTDDKGATNSTTKTILVATYVSSKEKIVFASDRSGNWDIWMMDPNGTNLEQLTTNSSSDTSPQISPDGTKIVFLSDRTGSWQVRLMNSDGSNEHQLFDVDELPISYEYAKSVEYPSWAPDGSYLITHIGLTGVHSAPWSAIYRHNPDGSNPRLFLDWGPSIKGKFSISNDGSKLAYCREDSNYWSPTLKISVGDIVGGIMDETTIHNLASTMDGQLDEDVVWFSNDTKLIWSKSNNPAGYAIPNNLYSMNVDETNSTKLTYYTDKYARVPDFSPDEQRVVFTVSDETTASLYAMNPDGSDIQPLIVDEHKNSGPCWGIIDLPSALPSYDAIVEGLNEIGMPDGIPGSIEALTDQPKKIVWGDEDSYSTYYSSGSYPPIVMACVKGDGRVISICQEGYFFASNINRYDNLQLGLNTINWLDKDGTKKILFDGRPLKYYWGQDVYYNGLVENITENGYTVDILEGEVSADVLNNYSIYIICTCWDPFTQDEIEAIVQYVQNGGGLFLTGVGWSWVSYHPESTIDEYPMNVIASNFDMKFLDDVIYDPTNYDGDPGHPIFHLFYEETQTLTFTATCPVDLSVTDPDGFTLTKHSNEISGATYTETDMNGDDDPDDQIIIPARKIGDYTITVTPESGAQMTDTYTLEVSIGDTTIVLAENVPISDIPDLPYVIVSTETGIIMPNQSPIANANGPYLGVVGEPITFNGTGSCDPDGTIVSYEWDLDGDGEFNEALGVTPIITFDEHYSGNIHLKVTDDKGATDIDSTTLTVLIPATIDFDPDTLNKKSKGKWVTVYTELPAGYNVTDINVSTMMLNETVPAELQPIELGDYDSDGILDLMVKFDRQVVTDILSIGDTVTITVTGKLYKGASFEGSDTIRVINEG